MPIIATVSAVQVAEALKLLVGDKAALHRSLMQFDLWQNDHRSISLGDPRADCKVCGHNIYEFLDGGSIGSSAILCGRDAVQIAPPRPMQLDLADLALRLKDVGQVKQNAYLVRFITGDTEFTVFTDGRAIIKGTDDVSEARSLYARYIGS
jgi:adenylyltransferase/sulfurtransferase